MKQLKNLTYGVNITLAAMIAGIMTYYCFYLGGYFNFLLENDLNEGLSVYHAQYLDSYEGVIIILLLVLQLIFALFALVLNFKKKLLPGLIIALLAPVVLLILHYGTGFSYAESTITDGSDLSAENIEFFLKVNIPYHIVYSLFYGTSAIWLYFQRK